MGVAVSKDLREQESRNREIDTELKKSKQEDRDVIKLLLLGPGESGKSTILKQMKILHANGFTEEDIDKQRMIIFANIVQAIHAILIGMDKLDMRFKQSERELDAKIVFNAVEQRMETQPPSSQLVQAMKRLWIDDGVRRCFARCSEYQLIDSAKYFLDAIDRVCRSNYVPNTEDIIRARARTTGVVEVHFTLKSVKFRVFDVGGQRSERKKWIHCFDDVKAVVFVASLSEYDQTLREDDKTDLFEEKLKRTSINRVFPEYDGDNSFEACADYVKQKYKQQNRNPQKEIYCHFTCATDSQQLQFVLDATIDVIVNKNLRTTGIV